MRRSRVINIVVGIVFGALIWKGSTVQIGCGQQTTLIPPGTIVRLAEPTSATIATYSGKDANGNPQWTVSANKVTLPAGYYVVPPPAAPTTQP